MLARSSERMCNADHTIYTGGNWYSCIHRVKCSIEYIKRNYSFRSVKKNHSMDYAQLQLKKKLLSFEYLAVKLTTLEECQFTVILLFFLKIKFNSFNLIAVLRNAHISIDILNDQVLLGDSIIAWRSDMLFILSHNSI